jgi:hypothetical protein
MDMEERLGRWTQGRDFRCGGGSFEGCRSTAGWLTHMWRDIRCGGGFLDR